MAGRCPANKFLLFLKPMSKEFVIIRIKENLQEGEEGELIVLPADSVDIRRREGQMVMVNIHDLEVIKDMKSSSQQP